MKFIFLTLVAFALACHAAEPPEERTISLTLPELRTMLATPMTRAEVEKKFGKPSNHHDSNWGVLMYRTSENKFVFFHFKGPHITGAHIGGVDIKGFSPKTYEMSVSFDDKKQKHLFHLDGVVFEEAKLFQTALKKLPKEAIVEWSMSCEVIPKIPDLQLKEIAERAGIYLIVYPAG